MDLGEEGKVMKNSEMRHIPAKAGMLAFCAALMLFTTSCSTLKEIGGAISGMSRGSASDAAKTYKKSGFGMGQAEYTRAEVFNQKIYLLSSEISSNLKQYNPEISSVVVSTFVNLHDLESSSSFGRFVTERLVHEMHKGGYHVYEIRQAEKIVTVPRHGEFNITRRGEELMNSYSSDAVVIGTYTLVEDILTLHVRMLERKSSRVISVGSTAFNIGSDSYAYSLLDRDDRSGNSISISEMEAE